MRSGRRILPAVLLLPFLVLCGCNRHPGDTAKALNLANQDSTTAAAPADSAAGSPASPDSTAAAQESAANPKAPLQTNTAPNNPPTSFNTAPELILPAGTPVTVRLQQRLSSASAVPGQRFEAVIDEPVVVQDRIVVPVGSLVAGHVVVARRSGRLHHPGEIGLTLDSVVIGQRRIRLATANVVARGASHKKRNWGWIGGGTGGGALIGGLAAGGKGLLIGSGIGAAAGTTAALLTGKKDVTFGSERRLRFRLNRDVSVPG